MRRLLCCSVLLITCACSSTPTVDQARTSIEAQITAANGGYPQFKIPDGVRLVDIHKTDGQSSEVFGVKEYAISYEGEIEFTQDGRCDSVSGLALLYFPPDTVAQWKSSPFMAGMLGLFPEVKKGQRRKFKGLMKFEKTENGWQPEGPARCVFQ